MIAANTPTAPPTMGPVLSGYRKEHLTESHSFDWTGLRTSASTYFSASLLYKITFVQKKNKIELLINSWALLCAVSWQRIHTSASFHTLHSGLYMSHIYIADVYFYGVRRGWYTVTAYTSASIDTPKHGGVSICSYHGKYNTCVNYHLRTVQVAYWST